MQQVQEEEPDKEVNRFIMKKLLALNFFVFIVAAKLFAQLTYSPITIKQLDASVCWNIKLQVNYETNRVQLFGKISNDEGKLLIETESDKLILRQGLQTFDASNVRTTNIKFHDDMQAALKILANSYYGFLGAPGLNYNYPQGAALITQKGREILSKAIKWASNKQPEEIFTMTQYEPKAEDNE